MATSVDAAASLKPPVACSSTLLPCSAASASESATRLRLKASDLNTKKEALTFLYTSTKGQQLLRLAGISGATPEAAAAAAMAPGRTGEQIRVAAEQALSVKVKEVAERLSEATAADKKASAVRWVTLMGGWFLVSAHATAGMCLVQMLQNSRPSVILHIVRLCCPGPHTSV